MGETNKELWWYRFWSPIKDEYRIPQHWWIITAYDYDEPHLYQRGEIGSEYALWVEL